MTRTLRSLAVLIAVSGVIDPAFAISRRQPVRIELVGGSRAVASSVRDRLTQALGGEMVLAGSDAPDAVVVAAPPPAAMALPVGVPVSVVMPAPPDVQNVRLLAAASPDSVFAGQDAVITAHFEGVRVNGQATTIELQRDGVTVAAVTHRWTRDREQVALPLSFVPPAAGVMKLTVAALALPGEATADDNAADLALLAVSPTLRIGVFEPRPSWAVGFVRRALEADPIFSTSSIVHPSRGRAVTAGPALLSLSAQTLASYDAVVVGAPEDLTATEVAALATFCERRGGAVVFAPDRLPSGPYAAMLSPAGFDEVLLEKPAALGGAIATGIRGSEFALPKRLTAGAVALASLPGADARAVILSVPRGRGRIVFSGALDAWRYRASRSDDVAFSHFWTGVIANLAASSPRRASISVRPAAASPGDRLKVHAAIDPQAFQAGGGEGPAVSAALVSRDGMQHFVRLWPGAETATFDGEIIAPGPGMYDARLSVAGTMVDTALLIADGIRQPPVYDDDSLRLIAATTGGVVADLSDTTALQRHLRELPRRDESRTVHPMRSAWWSLPFAAVLCAEWALRRRRGAR
jgi:hypothetical protein